MAGMEEFFTALGGLNQTLNNMANMQNYNNQSHEDRLFTIEMLERQTEKARENWQMQNEYNLRLPRLMRQAYEDAGLNPLILYGEGGSVMSASGNIGTPSSHAAYSPRYAMQAPGTQLGLELAQIQALRAETSLKEAESIKAAKEAESIDTDTKFARDSWDLRLKSIETQNSLNVALENTEVSKRNEIEAQIVYLGNLGKQIDADIENQSRLTDQQIKESEQRIDNSIKQLCKTLEVMDSELAKNYAETVYVNAQRMLIDNPEYRKYFSQQELEYTKMLIQDRKFNELQEKLLQKEYEMRTNKGSAPWHWQWFLQNYIDPLTKSVGHILGGSGSINYQHVPAQKPMRKIGF